MKERRLGWLAAEFVVIVLGVLLALAADRWNEGRATAEDESAYTGRLVEEIRADSLLMESFLDRLPRYLASRDTLIAALDGTLAPPNVAATMGAAAQFIDVPPPNAWHELEASSSLNILGSRPARDAVSTYYRVARPQHVLNLTRAQERGRDPFMDAAFRTGVFHPTLREDGEPITTLAEAYRRSSRPSDVEAFRASPGMRQLVEGGGRVNRCVNVSGGGLSLL